MTLSAVLISDLTVGQSYPNAKFTQAQHGVFTIVVNSVSNGTASADITYADGTQALNSALSADRQIFLVNYE